MTKPEDFDEVWYDVDHIDNVRANNHISNLRYMTHSDNVKKAYEVGNHVDVRDGVKNGRATFTVEQILDIREKFDNGESVMGIIKIYYPELCFKDRKKRWSKFKRICEKSTWKNV